jgi:putative intracellular protease/amidase
MEKAMRVLIVLTSHDRLGDTGEKTGFWLEELAAPYYRLKDAGAELVLASPKGGQPPLDPKSYEPGAQTDATRRFDEDPAAQSELANTRRLSDIDASDFDAVFYPGGHGPLWDLSDDSASIALIKDFLAQHLVNVKDAEGQPLVRGKRVTGFSNSEEAAVGLTEVVPFLLEDKLMALGGRYECGEDWHSKVVVDGHVINGQNPGSSEAVADALLGGLK